MLMQRRNYNRGGIRSASSGSRDNEARHGAGSATQVMLLRKPHTKTALIFNALRRQYMPSSITCVALPENCQLDTNMHLWRITAHNAVHRCEVTEMLKAPPHDFRAGEVAPTAPHKPAELGDPGNRLAQRRWLSRWRGDPMDGTIQRLPFVGLQENATRRIRHCTCQH